MDYFHVELTVYMSFIEKTQDGIKPGLLFNFLLYRLFKF